MAQALRDLAAKNLDGRSALLIAADHIESDGRDLIRLRAEVNQMRRSGVYWPAK
jgi:hypothetical protein